MNKLGHLYIIAAPSGTGKTSLVKALVESVSNIRISISHTTRPIRPGEMDEVDYHFVDENKFTKMIKDQLFLEYATIYGHLYGTSKRWVFEQLENHIDVVLEIDWQGARLIRQQFPQAVSIFILPPSKAVLHERLIKRQQDNPNVIQKRLACADDEVKHYHEFDYLVVNEDFDKALEDLKHIMKAQRLRCLVQETILSPLLAEWLDKQ